jgi:hypothetical protein
MTDRTQLILSSVRNYEFIKKAIDAINENLYKDELWEGHRIEMEVTTLPTGEHAQYVIHGTALDFFQIGLRYGSLEEKKQAKQISDILNRY